jgi:hypothetical protein
MTNGWVDIKNTDVILAMGGNPAENHPVGFKWFMEAKKTRGAKLVVVDPRFTRTAAVAHFYAPLRPGSDIAFLLGLIRYALETGRYHQDYVRIHTNGPYLIKNDFAFHDGLFSGWDEQKKAYAKDSWGHEADPKTTNYGLDPTMQNPRCVLQLLKQHVARYTPEMVERAVRSTCRSSRRRAARWPSARSASTAWRLASSRRASTACPTGCLQFGTKDEMVALGNARVAQLKENGFKEAMLYDPPGVGGTGVVTSSATAIRSGTDCRSIPMFRGACAPGKTSSGRSASSPRLRR